jgi:hypothetical protein
VPETVFSLLNVLPLPIWLGMLLFPKARFTQRLVQAYWPFVALGGVYTLLLLIALATGTGEGFDLSFSALRRSVGLEWGFLALWAHLITLDLFAGVWIFRDAKYWGVEPRPYVLLTLFTGPLGLGAYLLVRQRRTKNDPIKLLN